MHLNIGEQYKVIRDIPEDIHNALFNDHDDMPEDFIIPKDTVLTIKGDTTNDYIASAMIDGIQYDNILISKSYLRFFRENNEQVSYLQKVFGGKRRKHRKTRHRKMKRSKTLKRKVRR
jgi:hypothetical protein